MTSKPAPNTKKPKAKIPLARNIEVKPPTYQPSAKELNEKHDMPGMTDKQIRETFFRPFHVTEKPN